MLLILTNSQDATVDYLGSVLEHHQVEYLRFDTDKGLRHITISFEAESPCLFYDGIRYCPDDFENVWYRRPERLKDEKLGDSPEAHFALDEWAESLEGFLALIPTRRWLNHPALNVAASRKIEQLIRAKSLGFLVPDTVLTQDATVLRQFFIRHHEKIITKPLAAGYVERPHDEVDSLVYTNQVPSDFLHELEDLKQCPTLFQQMIDKDVDVRITVVDGAIHATELTAKDSAGVQRCDIRRNNMNDVTYRPIDLPDSVNTRIADLVQSYSLRFAAIDMAVTTSGDWCFFEINPNGQWAWLDLAGATQISESFVRSFSE